MRTSALKEAAINLEQVFLNTPKPSNELRDLRESLEPLIQSAKAKLILKPIEDLAIPGTRQQQEGVLSEYPDYEKQYVKFKVALRGGYTEEELQVLDIMKTL